MSLLLEALKKAEQAKQQGASGESPGGVAAEAVQPGSEAARPAGDLVERPLITRDRLPDITQPLEILTDDLPSSPPRAEPAPRASEATPKPQSATSEAEDKIARRWAGASPAADRDAVRQVFEAKEVAYNPKKPFYIALGALGVFALGIVGYFWYEMQPKYGYNVATQPPKPPAQITQAPPPAPAAQPQAAVSPAPAGVAAPAEAPQAAPTVPVATTRPQAAQPQAVPVPPQPSATGQTVRSVASTAAAAPPGATPQSPVSRRPATAESVQAAAPARPAGSAVAVSVTPPTQTLDATLEGAWTALQAGDLESARQRYQRVLAASPRNRDALLGLAAIDMRTQNFESAEARYIRVLEIDPRDPYAQAGLISLRGQTDPVQSESRVKNMLAAQPDATFLNFSLGNQYAAQSRWPEAQQAYFNAYAADPDNADYAYNLAVSLDHLRQNRLALEYYERSLALAAKRSASFNKAQVETRIRELAR